VREIALLEQRVGHATTVPEHDVLTGLLSASGLHRTAPRELERSHAEGRQLLLLVVDIARLRDVNGLHGFRFGDELLRQFARRLTATTNEAPMAARIGGDRSPCS
jgi:diguanylate cyclase (GGDEF)-like protein